MKKASLAAVVALVILICGCNTPKEYIKNGGEVFGTTFHIIYDYPDTLNDQIIAALDGVNTSLSTYQKSSVISRVNQNDSSVVLDHHFISVFVKGEEISEETNGAFDMTVAPLVNAWGFGFSKREVVTKEMVDSILEFVGYGKIHLRNGRILKDDSRCMIDASAIAKGYGVDVVGNLLDSIGVKNYLVEIGGEIRVKGVNDKNMEWSIAVDKPIDDPLVQNREFQEILQMSDHALASSGNYRNFYYENGVKYAHTINPKSGYPAQSEVLSSSVIAPDCMTADAFATAFMVLGLDASMQIVNKHPELEAYFICRGTSDGFDIHYSKGFQKYIKK